MASVEVRSVRKSTALRARNGPSKLQPARSMPVGYRYSAAGNGSGGGPKANGGSRLAAAAEADDEEMEEEVVRLEGDDADSPYSSKAATVEEVEDVVEKGGDGEEVDSAATPRRLSPTAATSPSQGDASGESGAGKTETAKIAMQYLASLGGGSGIEYEILQTNPILEAFGNAKTLRNDNSSRFGKLIEIHFSTTGRICGAMIQTFLLEKSRVVQSAVGERSYHIFYQLCAGAPASLKEKLNLKKVDEYKYLKQSCCYSIAGVDDAQMFRTVAEAMNIVHISKEDQENVFAMVSAVLWLGDVSFTVIDNENHVEIVVDEASKTVAELLGCSIEDLNLALSKRHMKVNNENIVQKLTLTQATDTRDALAKSVYASLFEWLVEQINKSLSVGKRRTGRSISILDIYGFESFDVIRTVLNSSALIMPMRGYNSISIVICLSLNKRYGFLLLEDVASQDPLSVSVAILHQFNILPEMYQVGYTKLFFRTGQIGKLEDTRNRTLHGIRGSLVRRCNGNIDLINVLREFESKQEAEGDQILIKASVLAELQRRILKAEATIREKDEENEMLHQRLQQYENRWLEYEQKMKAMEEMWQKQMRSLQSSLSVAKKSLALDETPRMSDSSVDQSWEINGNHVGSGSQLVPRTAGREMNAGLSVINRLTEEFEQRSQVFADDATFIVEVKSGQADASLNPDMELRRLKQNFDSWKKDFGGRIRETKVILNKLGNGNESSPNSVKRKWWGRLNTSKFS
nr:unnamed protein product [Digitaria exilis]